MELLTVNRCLGCKALKKFLTREKIKFTELDLRTLSPKGQAALLTDLTCSGSPGKAEDLLIAPILWFRSKGLAIPCSKLLDGNKVKIKNAAALEKLEIS